MLRETKCTQIGSHTILMTAGAEIEMMLIQTPPILRLVYTQGCSCEFCKFPRTKAPMSSSASELLCLQPLLSRDVTLPFLDFHQTPPPIIIDVWMGPSICSRAGEGVNRVYTEAIQMPSNQSLRSLILKY